jgi:hypothetical protein
MKLQTKTNDLKIRNILFCALILSATLFGGCQKNGGSAQSGGLDILSSDETPQAAAIVSDANGDLKKIRAIYKENEGRIEEIKTAMTNKESDKVQKIANDLVFQINDGISLGESAISKIEKAEELNINDTFREYLDMKRESLRKQLDAFEFRRQAAQIMSKDYVGKNPQEFEKVKDLFKEKEAGFQKLWDEGREQSQDANLFFKESLQKNQ